MLRSSLDDYKWSIKPQSSLTVIITSKNDLDFTKAMKTLSYQTLKHQPPGVQHQRQLQHHLLDQEPRGQDVCYLRQCGLWTSKWQISRIKKFRKYDPPPHLATLSQIVGMFGYFDIVLAVILPFWKSKMIS